MKRQQHLISLIIPAFKQEKSIAQDLRKIKNVMDQLRYNYEIIVVADGEVDKTLQNAKKIKSSKIHTIGYTHNHGKGYAVRFGMARAKGDIVAFIDAGMDLHPNGLSMLLEHFEWYNADIIVGSKLHPASKLNYPLSRKILSRGYQIFVKFLFGLSVSDTQVGMKFFKRQVLEDILPRLLNKTYGFDIEILAIGYYLGYKRIFEAPIELDFNGVGSIASKKLWRMIGLTLWDTLAVFYRLKIKHYYDSGNKRKWRYDPELNFRINLP